MKIWAHRGCSHRYPENTITAFARAVQIDNLAGIELDIQMTKDGEIVVIHDERVDRTTDGVGYVKDFTYAQIRKLAIEAESGRKEKIPSILDVFDLMQDKMEQGLMLNIELKNSKVLYKGMEEKILELITCRGLQKQIVYSSFNIESMEKLKKIHSDVSIGILDVKTSDCLNKKKNFFGREDESVALHPFGLNIDISKEELSGQTVRAWLSEPLYPERSGETKLELEKLEAIGITDVFLNEPELYLR